VAERDQALRGALVAGRTAPDRGGTLVLSTILAAVKNREIELARELTDEDVTDVLRRGIKTRRESVEQYVKGGRDDLAAAERAQIGVIQEFLPLEVDPDEIRRAVREVIAAGAADVGRVMGQVMPRFKGRADGKVINAIVREELQAK
jgi:uncharacterized protein YqeY